MSQQYSEEEIKNHRLLFIEALESGKYKQGFGWLKTGDCFCVEGVGCDVYVKHNLDKATWKTNTIFVLNDNYTSSLSMPKVICDWYNIDVMSCYLLSLNDTAKKDFNYIANVLRKEWNLPKENQNVSTN